MITQDDIDALTPDDYEEVLADTRRLTRELDVALHGEEGAAKQASLCDLIGPAREMRRKFENHLKGELEFNLNSYVRVKITERGLKMYAEHYSHSGSPTVRMPKVDDEGYTQMQLHSVMHIFGEGCSIGCNPPISAEIMLEL